MSSGLRPRPGGVTPTAVVSDSIEPHAIGFDTIDELHDAIDDIGGPFGKPWQADACTKCLPRLLPTLAERHQQRRKQAHLTAAVLGDLSQGLAHRERFDRMQLGQEVAGSSSKVG